MSQGIVYGLYGKSHIARLCVSMASLREVYKGPLHLYSKVKTDQMRQICKQFKASYKPLYAEDPNLMKVEILQKPKYDYNIYLDADTLITGKVDDMFPKIKQHQFMVTNYMDFKPQDSFFAGRFENFNDLGDIYTDALNYPVVLDGGVFGFRKGCELGQALCQYTEAIFSRDPERCFDMALQLVAPAFEHYTAPANYNMSSRYGNEGLIPKVIHYHGNRHTKDKCKFAEMWLNAFFKYRTRYEVPVGLDSELRKHLEK